MNSFTISQLQQLSGIKAHTIRIWEQRYNALTPDRSEGNTRSYNNEQLKRLLNIVSLLEEGYKISQLGIMTDQELHGLLAQKLQEYTSQENNNEYFISQLIAASMSYDEPHFNAIYNQSVKELGLPGTYNDVLYPMLKRMGLMWGIDSISPAQEHFSSHLIKQKIFSAIETLPKPTDSKRNWLLFLPENEFHEIPLLFSNYLIQTEGHKVIYLGSNVPLETLYKAVDEVKPTDLLFFFVHHINEEDAINYIQMLCDAFKTTKIHIAGNAHLMAQLSGQKHINWIQTPHDLALEIKQ